MTGAIKDLEQIETSKLKNDLSGVLARIGTLGEAFVIAQKKQAAGVLMSVEQYESTRKHFTELEEMLDHVLLYVELHVRESEESHGKITLKELKAKYDL